MTLTDSLFVAAVLLLTVVMPSPRRRSFRRRYARDPAAARRHLWSLYLVVFWSATALGLALWAHQGRSWEAMRLTAPTGWRLGLALVLVAATAVGAARPIVALARSRGGRRIRWKVPVMERLAPRSRAELALWFTVALTAGFTEEVLFRGYFLAAAEPQFGVAGAAAFSIVLFALGHAYQGAKGVLLSGLVGAYLTAVVLVLDSLWPAVALHALFDLAPGLMAWLALRKAGPDRGGEGTEA